jgi:paraquat-inducible protein B
MAQSDFVYPWTHLTISVNQHHKTLVAQDSKIESANKKLKSAQTSVNRAEDRVFEANRRATTDPDSEKYRSDLERAKRTHENAEHTYSKAVDASIDTIGTGSGHVMVLLPSRVAELEGTKRK